MKSFLGLVWLLAAAASAAFASDSGVLLTGDSVTNSLTQSAVVGHARMVFDDPGRTTLTADRVLYDRSTRQVRALGRATLSESGRSIQSGELVISLSSPLKVLVLNPSAFQKTEGIRFNGLTPEFPRAAQQ